MAMHMIRRAFVLDRVLVVFLCAVYIACFTSCNPYHDVLLISPSQEIAQSTESIEMYGAIVSVPEGWGEATVSRFAENGLPKTVSLSRTDYRGRIAHMIFEYVEEVPVWSGNADARHKFTNNYDDVVLGVISETQPSGDDTPGDFGVVAYTVRPDGILYMRVTFFAPVEPGLEDAVYYLDALQ